ncbi:MAG: SpoIIE family protein phosphatase [Nocardioidaceae bacterium]|nr:SpoIIE family protein phosphatase [Nocardioidaceae bacterium]NUS53143.1 SpoIIE family protein phosphatase [Nocardioidaceae bacterium]
MSLRVRLVALFAVLVAFVASAAFAVTAALARVEENHTLVMDRLQPAAVDSRALLVSLIDQETGQRGYVLTGDLTFLDPYREGRRDFALQLAEMRRKFRGDSEMQRALDAVQRSATRWHRVGAEPEIEARSSGDAALARQLVRAGLGKRAFDDVRDRVSALQAIIDHRTERAQERDHRELRTLRIVVVGSRATVLVLLVASALLTRHWVLLPVQRLRTSMREVAAGRLEHEVAVEGPPEVAAIGRDAEAMRRRIVSELEQARSATEALTQHSPVVAGLRRELSSTPRPMASGLDVAGMVLSAEGVLAGDWWEAVQRPDGSTALIVADVSGHGAEAGLVALRFKQRITALLDSEIDVDSAFRIAATRPDEDVERFLSCLLVVIDPGSRQVSWVNAGHPPALLVSSDPQEPVVELAPTGPLISAVTSGWTVGTAPMGERDLLLVCTDGVLEARNTAGEEFGEAGVVGVLRGLKRWAPEEAVAECAEAVRRFAVDVRRDDVTCVAVALSGS